MSDHRLRQLERAAAVAPADAIALGELDAERRRVGDGPWLPALRYGLDESRKRVPRATIEAWLRSVVEAAHRRSRRFYSTPLGPTQGRSLLERILAGTIRSMSARTDFRPWWQDETPNYDSHDSHDNRVMALALAGIRQSPHLPPGVLGLALPWRGPPVILRDEG